MAQLVVRNLDEEVKAKLRRRAAAHGRSMEEEVRAILRDAVKEEVRPRAGWERGSLPCSAGSDCARARRFRSCAATRSSQLSSIEWWSWTPMWCPP